MHEEDILREAIEIDERLKREGSEKPSSFPRWIFAMFFIFLMVFWVASYYIYKDDPRPKNIPSIEEVVPAGLEAPTHNNSILSYSDYLSLINPSDPLVKQTADRIVRASGCPASTVCHAKAIFLFVRDNFDYVPDPFAYEYVKSAPESLALKVGDCDDASVLLSNLLEAVGINTRFVFIERHVYVTSYVPDSLRRYKNDQGWIDLDATCDQCGFGEIPTENMDKPKVYVPDRI